MYLFLYLLLNIIFKNAHNFQMILESGMYKVNHKFLAQASMKEFYCEE